MNKLSKRAFSSCANGALSRGRSFMNAMRHGLLSNPEIFDALLNQYREKIGPPVCVDDDVDHVHVEEMAIGNRLFVNASARPDPDLTDRIAYRALQHLLAFPETAGCQTNPDSDKVPEFLDLDPNIISGTDPLFSGRLMPATQTPGLAGKPAAGRITRPAWILRDQPSASSARLTRSLPRRGNGSRRPENAASQGHRDPPLRQRLRKARSRAYGPHRRPGPPAPARVP